MKRSRILQFTASANEVCPETSISALQRTRRHSSFLISPSDHSRFHIGVDAQSGTCLCASGHWEPSESLSQGHLDSGMVVSIRDCCSWAHCCVGDATDIEFWWHSDVETYFSELTSTIGTALRENVEALGLLASRSVIANKRRIESRMLSDECTRVSCC
jgi:hypothetical protein